VSTSHYQIQVSKLIIVVSDKIQKVITTLSDWALVDCFWISDTDPYWIDCYSFFVTNI